MCGWCPGRAGQRLVLVLLWVCQVYTAGHMTGREAVLQATWWWVGHHAHC